VARPWAMSSGGPLDKPAAEPERYGAKGNGPRSAALTHDIDGPAPDVDIIESESGDLNKPYARLD
jgi:hypothetical protein